MLGLVPGLMPAAVVGAQKNAEVVQNGGPQPADSSQCFVCVDDRIIMHG